MAEDTQVKTEELYDDNLSKSLLKFLKKNKKLVDQVVDKKTKQQLDQAMKVIEK